MCLQNSTDKSSLFFNFIFLMDPVCVNEHISIDDKPLTYPPEQDMEITPQIY